MGLLRLHADQPGDGIGDRHVAALEQQLRLWPDASLALALDRLLRATGDSRKNYGSAETLTRRTFLALAQMAAQH